MFNLLNDLESFFIMPKKNLINMTAAAVADIAHCVKESYETNKDCIIDIGIGNLVVDIYGDELSFKFIPSENLQRCVADSIKNDKSTLQEQLEKVCSDRMFKIYKELL